MAFFISTGTTMKVNNNVIKLIFVAIFAIFPFFISDYMDDITPEKITSDLRFYEINTCSISIGELLINNINVSYQDHYRIVTNDYSSIKCFGTITGIDQINNVFYISVGTNPLITLFIQTTFWLLIMSFIKKTNHVKISYKKLSILTLSSLFTTVGIFVESRFYEKKLYFFDLTLYKSYIYFFTFILTITFFQYFILESRKKALISYIPLMFVFMQVYSGFNLYFLTFYLTTLGISKLVDSKHIRKFVPLLFPVVFFWSYSALGDNYYLDPDKIRGSISTIYNFLSVSYSSFVLLFLALGTYKLIENSEKSLNLNIIGKNILISTNVILLLGYLSSSQPLFNFFNYIFFGLTKYGTRSQEYFSYSEWGEKLAWRGHFPSAETIGEFSALGILILSLMLIDSYNNRESYKSYVVFAPLALFTLYLSNNRAAFVMLIICILLKVNKIYKVNKPIRTLVLILTTIFIGLIINIENLTYSINTSSQKIMNDAILYGLDYNYSSTIEYLLNLQNNNIAYPFILVILGQVSFLINRSEIWAIFLARYNPTTPELLLGTGPQQLSNLYSEINIFEYKLYSGFPIGFLLPHSSFIIFFIYFGLVGLACLFFWCVYKIHQGKKYNYNLYLINLFLFINLMKSDSVLYLPVFVLVLVFLLNNKKQYNFPD